MHSKEWNIYDGFVGTYWVACYIKNDKVTYYDGFGVEKITKNERIYWE